MTYFVLFLLTAFVIGGTRLGEGLRSRPIPLLGLCVLAAGSFYSLRIVL